MRLLNTETSGFQEFFDEQTPRYAILSHRWTDQEVSYKQYVEKTYVHGLGSEKIKNACAMARGRSLSWVWIDTICIDKTSSAELTEAINSMWHWYRGAAECYVFLADFMWSDDIQDLREALSHCEWFTRGWTLQELLAPSNVMFYDSKLRLFGTKDELAKEISAVTGINTDFLHAAWVLSEASVAMKMCWASRRKTTRIEDMAYCL